MCCNINSGKLAVKDEVLKMKTANTSGKNYKGSFMKYIQQAKLYPNFLKFLLSAVSFGDVQLVLLVIKQFLHIMILR